MIAVRHKVLIVTPLIEGGDVVEPLHERVLGRVTVARCYDPKTMNASYSAGTLLDEALD